MRNSAPAAWGEVYRAHDPRLGRDIAVKLIRAAAADRNDALDRLLREATLASALNHPNMRGARAYASFLAARHRPADAHTVLAPVLARLTEGHETRDGVAARALLDTLA